MGSLSLSGPDDILGAKRGFLSVMTDTPTCSYLTDFSNDDYCIEGIYQKLYAACRHCHPAIEAAIVIRKDFNILPEKIIKIEIHTYKLAVGSHDHVQIQGISSAKLSTPFSVALGIVKGNAEFADFNDENLEDRSVKLLSKKITVIEDKELTSLSPQVRGARVIIYMKNGEVFEKEVLYPKGEPENPLTMQEVEDKFRKLALFRGLSIAECNMAIGELQKKTFNASRVFRILCRKW